MTQYGKGNIAIKLFVCYIDNRLPKNYKASYNLHSCNLKDIFLVVLERVFLVINVITYLICMMNTGIIS